MARLTSAELKQLVKKPEVVEWTTVTTADPRLLLHLKSQRIAVPIPIRWTTKRDDLQGKRGIEKPPFQLSAYIADAGTATMRHAVKEKEANMSFKSKTREPPKRLTFTTDAVSEAPQIQIPDVMEAGTTPSSSNNSRMQSSERYTTTKPTNISD